MATQIHRNTNRAIYLPAMVAKAMCLPAHWAIRQAGLKVGLFCLRHMVVAIDCRAFASGGVKPT